MACSPAEFSSNRGAGELSSNGGGGGTGGGANVTVTPLPGTNPGDATGTIRQDCQNQLQQSTVPIKLLFVVDTSGSNVNDTAADGGSDPLKAVRGGSIQEFFNLYKMKTNFSWGFSVFSESSARALIGTSSAPTFTTNASDMQAAINNFLASKDSGNTPYVAALDMAYKTINNDAARTQQTKWVVVFLSDGLPNPDVAQTTLNTKVQSIVGLLPGQITFNTIYYGDKDDQASGRLATMAQVGGGKFLDTNANPTGKSFQILDVINVPGTACK